MNRSFSLRPHHYAAYSVLRFWFEETKPAQWYRRDDAFDAVCAERFGKRHDTARNGDLAPWRVMPGPALAEIILLDQLSRNLYRDTPRAFAADALARTVARAAIARRFDRLFEARERAFFYMPFMHSEALADQDLCFRLFRAGLPASNNVHHAKQHRDIIYRFGRFPHRNKTLDRTSTPAELQFLATGGFNP